MTDMSPEIASETAPDSPPFAVRVRRVTAVREAPGSTNLTLVTLSGYPHELVANKREDGSFRYAEGDLAVVFPEGAILDEPLLRLMGYWDEAKNRGMLGAGSKKNRVKMIRFGGHESRGALLRVEREGTDDILSDGLGNTRPVVEDEDVAEFLRVKEHVAG